MSTPKRTGRRAAAKLVTTSSAHASASSAFLSRIMRRGKPPLSGAATTDSTANFWHHICRIPKATSR